MERVRAIANAIATQLGDAQLVADADLAALLAKTDLVTDMVGEFPELQGVMGAYYARHDGESDAVAAAVAEHYSPLGPNDACPSAPLSVAVALADKLGALVGSWRLDERPTGSKDPFALRRAAPVHHHARGVLQERHAARIDKRRHAHRQQPVGVRARRHAAPAVHRAAQRHVQARGLAARHDAARILGSGQQAGGGHHVNIAQKQMVLNKN